ncbi:protein YpfM [Leclercia sp. LTM14]|uniref:Protein YpfM n=1 Tax=Leclercia barmai TaxID=2785629 RepID=A0ABS7RQJ8_9ENTR|nr:protein YpfM [Leclercia sp. EMC7]MCM5699317.1 protein YpfM [Leclercia sp. LTM14]
MIERELGNWKDFIEGMLRNDIQQELQEHLIS